MELKFTGLKPVLNKFDEHKWEGSFSSGDWRIANGGYDLWFELYYCGNPVAQCVNGKLSSHFGLPTAEKDKLLNKILEIYDHLKIEPAKAINLPDVFDDLSEVPTETLQAMAKQAFSKYYSLATEPCGDWKPGTKFSELEEATNRLNAINDELERRTSEKKPPLDALIDKANAISEQAKGISQSIQSEKAEPELE